MSGKQMQGNDEQRRAMAREAREHGKSASEVGASHGASKQRDDDTHGMTHQEKIDLEREGKQEVIEQNTPVARPGSRDDDTPEHERLPRL